MLTRDITTRREIPHEPGEWMVFQLLSWRALQEARDTRQAAALKSISGVADVVRELQSARTSVEVQAAEVDPLTEFDRGTLLRKGIKAWSYPPEPTQQTIDELDEQTAVWAAREILSLHTRTEQERLDGLFRTGTVPLGTG